MRNPISNQAVCKVTPCTFSISTFLIAIALVLLSAPPVHASIIGKPANNLGLVGYWKMDEGSGMRAADSSGFGNFGTTTGATWAN